MGWFRGSVSPTALSVALIAGAMAASHSLLPSLGRELRLRQASVEDWPAIERILQVDRRVVETKARLRDLSAQLRAGDGHRFYLVERVGEAVGVVAVRVGSQVTFDPFYLAAEDIRLAELLPLFQQILLEHRKDGRAVLSHAYRDVLPVLRAACGDRVDVRPLTDRADPVEITIRYQDLLSRTCHVPSRSS